MCEHCADGRIPVRLTDENGEGAAMIGEVVGVSIVEDTGTVYMCVNGVWMQATVPQWHGPDPTTRQENAP